MRWWGLAAAVAALVLAVPASATHSPNGVREHVTMTVTREGLELAFQYQIDELPCPNPHCGVNYGKAYEIKLYVDRGGLDESGLASWSRPVLVRAPEHCTVAGAPLVTCDVVARNVDDPSKALPMIGEFRVLAGTVLGTDAEIDVIGYSVNYYLDEVPVPKYDCVDEEINYDHAKELFQRRFDAYLDRLDYYNKNFAGTRFVARLLLLDFALEHDELLEALHTRGNQALNAYKLLAENKVAYLDCQQGMRKGMARFERARATTCSDDKLEDLLKRGKVLKLKKVVPLVRKIRAEQKMQKRSQAARDIKRLKTQAAAEAKSVKTYLKALRACNH